MSYWVQEWEAKAVKLGVEECYWQCCVKDNLESGSNALCKA